MVLGSDREQVRRMGAVVWFHCAGGRVSDQGSWTTSDTAAATLFFEGVDHQSDAKKITATS